MVAIAVTTVLVVVVGRWWLAVTRQAAASELFSACYRKYCGGEITFGEYVNSSRSLRDADGALWGRKTAAALHLARLRDIKAEIEANPLCSIPASLPRLKLAIAEAEYEKASGD